MSIELSEGTTLYLEAAAEEDSAEFATINLGQEIPERHFDACPICGSPANTREDVPPKSMRGKPVTSTCKPCNNRLGRNVEHDLAAWYHDATTDARFEAPGIPGRRRSGRILWRTAEAGQALVLAMDSSRDDAIPDMLRQGTVTLEAYPPDENRCRLALLKAVYLAKCMQSGVPQGPIADEVRRDLIAARDAASRHEVPPSPLAFGLIVMRFEEPVPGVTAPIVTALARDPNEGPSEGVLLARRVYVSWPSRRGVVVLPQRAVRATPEVQGFVNGTVTEVIAKK
jgi:hypothetical protein